MEKLRVIEQYTTELKKSEYGRMEAKEVILCGMKGWKTKMGRRQKEGKMYRSARSTLVSRCKRKLTAKTTWYKKKKGMENEEEEKREKYLYRRKEMGVLKERKEKEEKKTKAVMFVQFTPHSELAKRLRTAEEKLGELIGYKLKIVV